MQPGITDGFWRRLPADLPSALWRRQTLSVLVVGLLLTWGQVTVIERRLANRTHSALALQASEALIAAADVAMYQVKGDAEQRVSLYRPA
jgi:hypothetical protein